MTKIIDFPADRVAKGTHIYYPDSQYKAGWFSYEVTIRAYEKLNHDYSFSEKMLLD